MDIKGLNEIFKPVPIKVRELDKYNIIIETISGKTIGFFTFINNGEYYFEMGRRFGYASESTIDKISEALKFLNKGIRDE